MNVFDVIGPVMIGPSSSHTAGIVRIGNVVHRILGGVPTSAIIRFHGSLAATYKGHGSDKAVIGGVLGFNTDDENIIRSFDIANEMGLNFSFETIQLRNAHPNTVVIEATRDETLTLVGESVGGGNILIKQINDIHVAFDGVYDTIIVNHTDISGTISQVTQHLAMQKINIANMSVYRSRKGGEAIMVIEADQKLYKALEKSVCEIENVIGATVISGLR